MRGPRAAWRYARAVAARREPRHLGHNPLGGAWIVLMLSLVVAAGVTGWMLTGYGHHEALAGGLLAAAAVHVAGVAYESLRHAENLVRAMVTGRKRSPGPEDA